MRGMRGAEIESDHFLVRAKIRLKIKRSEIKKWYIGKPDWKEVKDEFIKEVITNTQNTQLEVGV
jgi:hypothetical protein